MSTIAEMVKNEGCFVTLSGWATCEFIKARNEWLKDKGVPAAIGITVFGELCFVALAVASAVEAVIRAIFGVVLGVPLKCLEENKWMYGLGLGGAFCSAGNAAICVAALWHNIWKAELVHEEILHCADTFMDSALTALGI